MQRVQHPTSPQYNARRLSLKSRAFLVVVFVLFNLFAVVRALPENSRLPENREAHRGSYARNVYRVFKLANRQAARPFFEVKNHSIFFDRNPGMFMFEAELFVRAGATTPFPNQLFAILMWNAGLALLYLWLLRLFRSEITAAAGLSFAFTTPFALFFSSSIHHEPWCFFFFNLMFYCFVRYLTAGQQRKWFIATWVAYFLLCQSYWFYYVSAGILVVALQVREAKFSLRDAALLALVPVVAMFTTFLQVVYALGGVDSALFRMKDIAAARTLDMRIENSRWFPDRTFVTPDDIHRYHWIIKARIELLSGYSLWALGIMLSATVALAGPDAWKRQRWLLLVLLAGISWHLIMIQHTVIHRGSGMYGWFMWVLLAAAFVDQFQHAVRPERVRWAVTVLAIPFAYFALQRDYVPSLSSYLKNAHIVDAGIDVTPQAPADEPKPKKKSRKQEPGASDSLTDADMKAE